jgi:hypothetical protein
MKLIYYSLLLLISSLSCLTTFTLHINKHYTNIAGNILNLNDMVKNNKDLFKSISYYHNNHSICYNYDHKKNIKYMLKDKYNYLISFDIYKYKYLIILKSKPVSYNYTEIDIDIRQNRNIKFNNTQLNFNHYKRIDNIIYKYIYNNIILKNNDNDISTDLFKFFNNY